MAGFVSRGVEGVVTYSNKARLAALSELVVTQGQGAGKPLQLMPWQRRFVRKAFADDVQTAALSVARGNGKSTLVAGLAVVQLQAPATAAAVAGLWGTVGILLPLDCSF